MSDKRYMNFLLELDIDYSEGVNITATFSCMILSFVGLYLIREV